MKAGWETVALSKIADVSTGPFGSLLNKRDYTESGVPLVNPIDIVDGKVLEEKIKRVSEETAKRLSAYRLDKNDVVVARRGDLGRCAAISDAHRGWLCGTGSFFVRPTGDVCSRYLTLLIGCPRAREYFGEASTGATMPNISNKTLSDLLIPLPPLEEQRRIVAILDEAFAGLDRARANAEANLRDARELHRSFIDAAIGDGDWPIVALENLVAEDCSLSYGVVQPGDDVEDGLPIVRPTDFGPEVIGLSGLKRIDPNRATSYARTALKGGEILLCVRGTTGNLALAHEELVGANVTRGIVPINFDPSQIDQRFGYFQLQSQELQEQIARHTYGAALMQINIRETRKLLLKAPPLEVQRRIVEKLSAFSVGRSELEQAAEAKLADLADLRQSLLQRAFAGELT